MRKAITLTLSIALLGIFAAVVVAAVGPSDGTSTLPTSTDRTNTTPDNTAIDISGPCDEAEHANDPRCAGVQAPTETAPAEDISGPCDEAEHANDPRCTGVGVGDDDNSGHRSRPRRGSSKSSPTPGAGPARVVLVEVAAIAGTRRPISRTTAAATARTTDRPAPRGAAPCARIARRGH